MRQPRLLKVESYRQYEQENVRGLEHQHISQGRLDCRSVCCLISPPMATDILVIAVAQPIQSYMGLGGGHNTSSPESLRHSQKKKKAGCDGLIYLRTASSGPKEGVRNDFTNLESRMSCDQEAASLYQE